MQNSSVRQGNNNQLIDRTGRRVSYIRISVTDRCDLRCQYCMPMRPVFLPKSQVLTLEQLYLIAETFIELGVDKVRITGGEPLVRKNVTWLLSKIAGTTGIRETVLTTNGTRLPEMAHDVAKAGIKRLNISIDTLDSTKFRTITRNGELARVLDGFQTALTVGFENVKINTVLMKGFNDDELTKLVEYASNHGADISFIEEMPIGDVGRKRSDYQLDSHQLLSILRKRFSLKETDHTTGGPAQYWQLLDSPSKIGIIAPHSRNFCSSCNRVRITCTGDLYPCLGQNGKISLANAAINGDKDELARLIHQSLANKPDGHEFDLNETQAHVVRFMTTTGG